MGSEEEGSEEDPYEEGDDDDTEFGGAMGNLPNQHEMKQELI